MAGRREKAAKTNPGSSKGKGGNNKSDILLLVADDGKVYKIETKDWRTKEHLVTDTQALGVINQLTNFGVVVADLPNDVAPADGLECKLVNVGALTKLDQ